MGIFQFTRQNHVTVSEDWKLFADLFHNIGAFTYKDSLQTVYFDENAQRILNVGKFMTKNEYKISRENFIVYHLKDGTAIGYNKYAQDCRRATQENCVGFIDANGLGGPNRITKCDDKGDWKTSCSISVEKIHDIYPVVFYNQTIEPATVAGKSILNGLKENK